MANNLNNLSDKAISDEELEQVSGGAFTLYCTNCGTPLSNEGGVWVCPKCGK